MSCNGCLDSPHCYIQKHGRLDDIDSCPCSECIIKVMCKDECRDYSLLGREVKNYVYSKEKE